MQSSIDFTSGVGISELFTFSEIQQSNIGYVSINENVISKETESVLSRR